MNGLGEAEEGRELWRRWRALGNAEPPAAAPDALALARYAEGRLSEAEAESVEDWLAARPERLAEIAAARGVAQQPLAAADEAMIAKACALVAGDDDPKIVKLRPAGNWRNALAWSSVAASLVAVSLVGFAMGSDAYRSLSGSQTTEAASIDTIDGATSLDSYLSDDSGT